MRQIVLDTETTGISHEAGHRIIEIGCIELIERKFTGKTFHVYLNPQREVEEGAFRVHGISTEFLQDKPLFKEVVQEFIEFINNSELIIHNAAFDVGFLNAEFKHLNWNKAVADYCGVCDTLQLAREKHPGQRNSLDALCKRYEVDNSNRQLHGALLDAELLAFVYLAMTGGQGVLFADDTESIVNNTTEHSVHIGQSQLVNSPIILPTVLEQEHHDEFIQHIIKKSGINLWQDDDSIK